MNRKAPRLFLWGILALSAAVGYVLVSGTIANSDRAQRSGEFQGLVRGLGFGPALDLSQCPYCFDPRIAFFCRQETGPIPGACHFCSQHACSIFYYPGLTDQEPKDLP